MAEGVQQTLLARIAARGRPPAAEAVTPTRALRIAFTRAAERAVGLKLTVLGVGDETADLAGLLARLSDGWLLLRLHGAEPTDAPGLVAVDHGLVAAVIESQMRGRLSAATPEPRPLTAADAALVEPLVAAFLGEIARDAGGTGLDAWVAGRAAGGRLADLRAAELALPDGGYRIVGLSADLGAGEREGQILLALPDGQGRPGADHDDARRAAWSAALQGAVLAAPAAVEAVLHRMRLPLRAVQGLQIGQKIALPGVRVSSVRLETPDGRLVGRGRLGQVGGMRAVRIEPEPVIDLVDVAPRPPGLPGTAPHGGA